MQASLGTCNNSNASHTVVERVDTTVTQPTVSALRHLEETAGRLVAAAVLFKQSGGISHSLIPPTCVRYTPTAVQARARQITGTGACITHQWTSSVKPNE